MGIAEVLPPEHDRTSGWSYIAREQEPCVGWNDGTQPGTLPATHAGLEALYVITPEIPNP